MTVPGKWGRPLFVSMSSLFLWCFLIRLVFQVSYPRRWKWQMWMRSSRTSVVAAPVHACGLFCFCLQLWADTNTLVARNSMHLKSTWRPTIDFTPFGHSHVETSVGQLSQLGALQAQGALCGYWEPPQLLFHALPLVTLWRAPEEHGSDACSA